MAGFPPRGERFGSKVLDGVGVALTVTFGAGVVDAEGSGAVSSPPEHPPKNSPAAIPQLASRILDLVSIVVASKVGSHIPIS